MNMDKDKDGKLSREEAPGPLKEHFDAVDKNSDKQLDESELKAHAGQMMERFREAAAKMRERGPNREGRPPMREKKSDGEQKAPKGDKKPATEERSDAGPPEPEDEAVSST